MKRSVGFRFWVEAALATLTGVLGIATMVSDEWIEAVSGVEPDGGDGSLELVIVVGLLVATLVLAVLARGQWRRAAVDG